MLMRLLRAGDRRRSVPWVVLRSACASLVLLLSACEGTSAPSGLEGRYSAYTVNGRRPPTTVFARRCCGEQQVVDAAIRLHNDGGISVELSTRGIAPDGTVGQVERVTYSGTFQRQGDVLVVDRLQGPEFGLRADGIVISPREIGVTLRFFQYPVFILARR